LVKFVLSRHTLLITVNEAANVCAQPTYVIHFVIFLRLSSPPAVLKSDVCIWLICVLDHLLLERIHDLLLWKSPSVHHWSFPRFGSVLQLLFDDVLGDVLRGVHVLWMLEVFSGVSVRSGCWPLLRDRKGFPVFWFLLYSGQGLVVVRRESALDSEILLACLSVVLRVHHAEARWVLYTDQSSVFFTQGWGLHDAIQHGLFAVYVVTEVHSTWLLIEIRHFPSDLFVSEVDCVRWLEFTCYTASLTGDIDGVNLRYLGTTAVLIDVLILFVCSKVLLICNVSVREAVREAKLLVVL